MKIASLLSFITAPAKLKKMEVEFTQLQEKYNVLEEEHETLVFDYLATEYELKHLKGDVDFTEDDAHDARLQKMHSVCSCGGERMPLTYENPEFGSFCKRCG